MPYGPFVGQWRRELLALCSTLNPVVMDIRNQPSGEIEDIKNAIHETEEYIHPMKEAVVNRKMDKAVSNNRQNILAMICTGENKPAYILENTWKILERLLENIAVIFKSETMSRAIQ
jgi:hypothetical protein